MGYYTTYEKPCPVKTDTPAKNRVWDFSASSRFRTRQNPSKPLETTSETSVTVMIIVSGLPFWPSRDPLAELAFSFQGQWLDRHSIVSVRDSSEYGFVQNNPILYTDRLGLAPCLTCPCWKCSYTHSYTIKKRGIPAFNLGPISIPEIELKLKVKAKAHAAGKCCGKKLACGNEGGLTITGVGSMSMGWKIPIPTPIGPVRLGLNVEATGSLAWTRKFDSCTNLESTEWCSKVSGSVEGYICWPYLCDDTPVGGWVKISAKAEFLYQLGSMPSCSGFQLSGNVTAEACVKITWWTSCLTFIDIDIP